MAKGYRPWPVRPRHSDGKYMASTDLPAFAPQPGPQAAFLASPADIAIYGGAAGGGKTWALLMEPLRHVRNPGFGAVIFRRTTVQVRNKRFESLEGMVREGFEKFDHLLRPVLKTAASSRRATARPAADA